MTSFSKEERYGYHRAQVSVLSGETSEPAIVDMLYSAISMALIPNGTAKIQYSVCEKSLIESGGAYWFDWDAGEVTDNTVDTIHGVVTAIRIVSVNGSAVLKVVSK